MCERIIYVKMLKPYGVHDLHQKGEIIPIYHEKDAAFLIENGIAKFVKYEDSEPDFSVKNKGEKRMIKMQIGYHLQNSDFVTMDKSQVQDMQGSDFEEVYVLLSAEWIQKAVDASESAEDVQKGYRLQNSDLVTIDKSLIHNTRGSDFQDVQIALSSRLVRQLAEEIKTMEDEEEDVEYFEVD